MSVRKIAPNFRRRECGRVAILIYFLLLQNVFSATLEFSPFHPPLLATRIGPPFENSIQPSLTSFRTLARPQETNQNLPLFGQREASQSFRAKPAGLTTMNQKYIDEIKKLAAEGATLKPITSHASPELIASYLWHHFEYETDQRNFGREEYWQSAKEFVASRKGDCEDFALFASAVLRINGIKSFLFNVYSDRSSHTVTVFEDEGKFSVIDGTKVRRFRAETFEALLMKMNPFWKEGAIVALSSNLHEGRILKQFHREDINKKLALIRTH